MVGQQEDHVGLDMFLGSLPNQGYHLQASLTDDKLELVLHLRGQPLHLQMFV
jgi:hypothetical protein